MLSKCSFCTRLSAGIDFSMRLDPSPPCFSVGAVDDAADSASLDEEADTDSPLDAVLSDELASPVWLSLTEDELIIALLLKLSFELFIDVAVLAVSALPDEDKNRFDEGSRGDNEDDSSGLSGDLSNLLSCG